MDLIENIRIENRQVCLLHNNDTYILEVMFLNVKLIWFPANMIIPFIWGWFKHHIKVHYMAESAKTNIEKPYNYFALVRFVLELVAINWIDFAVKKTKQMFIQKQLIKRVRMNWRYSTSVNIKSFRVIRILLKII